MTVFVVCLLLSAIDCPVPYPNVKSLGSPTLLSVILVTLCDVEMDVGVFVRDVFAQFLRP